MKQMLMCFGNSPLLPPSLCFLSCFHLNPFNCALNRIMLIQITYLNSGQLSFLACATFMHYIMRPLSPTLLDNAYYLKKCFHSFIALRYWLLRYDERAPKGNYSKYVSMYKPSVIDNVIFFPQARKAAVFESGTF